MNTKEYNIPRDILPRIKADLEKTLAAYGKVTQLRQKKMEQDIEQIKVYLNILENQTNDVTLKNRNAREINRILSWKEKNTSHRKQQDELEDHFLELQKILVGLISKRFKY
jgi:hypothetical protein